MREEKFHIYLNDDEYSRVIQSLIRLKNSLIAQGRYTDGVDDVLCKVLSAKKRKVKIKYVGVGSSRPYFVGNNGPFFVGKLGANQ